MMSKTTKHRTVSATELKAQCSAYLDRVEAGETVTITRRGRAVAVLAPVRAAWKSPANSLAGKVEILGDIVNFSMWEDSTTRSR